MLTSIYPSCIMLCNKSAVLIDVAVSRNVCAAQTLNVEDQDINSFENVVLSVAQARAKTKESYNLQTSLSKCRGMEGEGVWRGKYAEKLDTKNGIEATDKKGILTNDSLSEITRHSEFLPVGVFKKETAVASEPEAVEAGGSPCPISMCSVVMKEDAASTEDQPGPSSISLSNTLHNSNLWYEMAKAAHLKALSLPGGKPNVPAAKPATPNPNLANKPMICRECGKGFTQKQHLRDHKLTHTGEKPFSCPLCYKNFTQKQHLKRHEQIHTGAKPFTCVVCSKSFIQKQQLKDHSLVHTGEKPFSCGECGKCFSHRKGVKQHSLSHTGEKPFSCGICGKHFTQRQNLRQHALIHTGEKPFSCGQCGKSYRLGRYLVRHTLSAHGIKKPTSRS